jgi:Ca2+-binding EF-hand superfamily protein
MRAHVLAITVIASFSLCASCGGSQPQTTTPPTASGQAAAQDDDDDDDDAMPHLHGFLAEMDQNKDGKVTLEEAKATAAAHFAAAETNKDGFLDADEMRAMHKGHMQKGAGPRGMARLDKDGNGSISRDEAPPRLLQKFDELDANHDGSIDKDEMAAMRKGHGKGPAHPGAMMDADGDGKVSPAEHAEGAEKMFKMMDMDGDGAITEADVKAAREKHHKK